MNNSEIKEEVPIEKLDKEIINKDDNDDKNVDQSKENTKVNKKSEKYVFPKRYIVVILCWSGLLTMHAMRVNIGMTVVTILDKETHQKVELKGELPKVLWNSKMIGFLHSIFYIGFIITQIPGGCISRKSYVTKVFSLGIAVSSLLNLLLPIGIESDNYIFTCIVRLCQGLSEGLVFPALYKIMDNWFPTKSIHKYGGWIFGGMYAGPIIGFPLDGAIIHYWKWPFVYYLHCLLGIIWFVMSYILLYENPKSHPTITANEIDYITLNKETEKKEMKIPWTKIFSCPAVWAIVVCNFNKSWMFILMLTNEPVYLNQFKFSIVENGIFSAIPHVLKVLIATTSGYLAELLLSLNKISKTNVRKLFNSLGFGIEAISCYILVVIHSGVEAVIFLCIGIGFSGLAVSGWQINALDISPEFSGVIAGFAATFGTLGGILSPIIIGIMTYPQTLQNWQYSFIVSASILTFGTIIFAIFGNGEPQNWNPEESVKLLESKK